MGTSCTENGTSEHNLKAPQPMQFSWCWHDMLLKDPIKLQPNFLSSCGWSLYFRSTDSWLFTTRGWGMGSWKDFCAANCALQPFVFIAVSQPGCSWFIKCASQCAACKQYGCQISLDFRTGSELASLRHKMLMHTQMDAMFICMVAENTTMCILFVR